MLSRYATTGSTMRRACVAARSPHVALAEPPLQDGCRGALAEVGLEDGRQRELPAFALGCVQPACSVGGPLGLSRLHRPRLRMPPRRRHPPRHRDGVPPCAVGLSTCRRPPRPGSRRCARDRRPGRHGRHLDREADHPALGAAVGDEHGAVDAEQRRAAQPLVVESLADAADAGAHEEVADGPPRRPLGTRVGAGRR